MKNILAKQAWTLLEKDPNAVLVDVRTPEEWAVEGFPDLASLGREALALTWRPDEAEDFLHALRRDVKNRSAPVLFLCRSGSRSHHASVLAEEAGYRDVTNLTDGFEDRHGSGTGWREGGLPVTYRPLSGSKSAS